MVLAQTHTHRSMELDRKSRNKLMHLRSINLQHRRQEYTTEKRQSLQQVVLGKLDSYMQKNEIRTFSTPFTKINSKWIKDLNVRLDTMKLLEENIDSTVFDINCSKIFLDPSPRLMEIKTKINKWDLTKLKSFCTAKENTNKMKRQPMEWEKIFANDVTNKGLISKIYKQLMQLNIKKKKTRLPWWCSGLRIRRPMQGTQV